MPLAGFRAFKCASCCIDCLIGEDLFNDDLSQWTTDGTVSVATGKLSMTATASAYFTPEPLSVNYGAWVRVTDAVPLTGSDTLQIRVARTSDGSNYLFGELSISGGVGTVRVGDQSGTLGDPETLDETGTELEGPFTILVCWFPGNTVPPVSDNVFRLPQTVGAGVNWTDKDNVKLEDDAPATRTFTLVESDSIVVSHFGLRGFIPPRSTIDGVTVNVRALYVPVGGMGEDPIELFAQLGTAAGAVGDVKGPVILGTSYTVQGFGSATDDWNAGLTWEDVSDDEFSVTIRCDNPVIAEQRVEIDWIGITIDYTTPSLTRGKIQIAVSTKCVTHFADFDTASLGTGNGLVASAGEWDMEAYRLELIQSTAKPTCPDCCGEGAEIVNGCTCCENGGGETQATLSIGSIGAGTGECDGCAGIGGTYIVDFVGACTWWYTEELDCGGLIDCPGGTDFETLTLSIVVWLHGQGTQDCRWKARVFVGGCDIVDPSDPDANGANAIAEYQSAVIDIESTCPEFPITLNRIGTPSGGDTCTVSYPATLTLDNGV